MEALLSNEQMVSVVNDVFERRIDIIDHLIALITVDREMNKEEKDAYYVGFAEGFKVNMEISEFIVKTRGSKNNG